MADILNATSCGIFSFSDEGKILQANAAICAMLQVEKEQLIGQPAEAFFTVSTRIFFQTHLYPLLKFNNSLEEIFVTLKGSSNKEIPIILSARRIVEHGIAENIFSCLTVYNRKNFEEEIIRAKNEAEKTLRENTTLTKTQHTLQEHVQLLDEKMFLLQQYNETLKQIGYAVSHELQEPVRKLNLFVDMLLHHKQDNWIQDNEERINAQIQKLKLIISGLQQYVWLDDSSDGTITTDLNELLESATKKLHAENPGVRLVVHAKDLPHIAAKPKQMELLFYHLLSNAIRFGHPERTPQVNISATTINRNQFKLLQNHYSYRRYHKIDVTDNGRGFDPEFATYIFELFKKLDASQQGSGIGLTLSKKIVLNHNGMITATSREGIGSIFTIYLPEPGSNAQGI
jgi:phosphoserine phosphatase RsbU/P